MLSNKFRACFHNLDGDVKEADISSSLSKSYVMLVFLVSLAIRLILFKYYMATKPFSADPLSVDEVVYVKAGRLYINHFLEGHQGLDKCLQYNYEHPMFAKMLIGLSLYLLSPVFGENFAARFVGILTGALTSAILCYLGGKLWNPRLGLFSGLTLSFDHLFIRYNLLAYLDNSCIFFILLSISLFFMHLDSMKKLPFLFSGIFLGFAVASKYFGFLAVPIVICWLMPRFKDRRKLIFALAWIFIGIVTFIIVQPRLWYDLPTRLYESWLKNYNHNVNGHPIPISSIIGDGSWVGERMMPPIWTVAYWLIAPASSIEVLSLMLLITVVPILVKEPQGRLMFILFIIPLAYFTAQPVKLPQYLTIIKPGSSFLLLMVTN
ncbi:MAG: glycosyltransferase family 39 protein [Candidatus Bathyarchaeia archaeon]